MGLLFSKTTPRFVVVGPPNPPGEGTAPPKRLNIVDFVKERRQVGEADALATFDKIMQGRYATDIFA